MLVKLEEVWRDRLALDAMQREITRQRIFGWRPWEILLPPELLYPMLEEVSSGMVTSWSPTVCGAGVQVGNQGELAIRFVRTGEKESPVMVKSMPYQPFNKDAITPIEVNNGHQIRG